MNLDLLHQRGRLSSNLFLLTNNPDYRDAQGYAYDLQDLGFGIQVIEKVGDEWAVEDPENYVAFFPTLEMAEYRLYEILRR